MRIKMDRRFYIALAIMVAVTILLMIMFRGCDRTPKVQPVKVVVDTSVLVKERKQWEKEKARYIDSIEDIKQYKRESDMVLKAADKELKRLIKNYNELRDSKQPITIIEVCDSIVEMNAMLLEEREANQKAFDDLIGYYEAAMVASDSAAIQQTKINTELRAALLAQESAYNTLAKDFNKQLRKKKQERTLNRVLAGAALVLGGFLIVK